MGEILIVIGKASLALANMLATVVFFKAFWDNGDTRSLYIGIIVLVLLYLCGAFFLYFASQIKGENNGTV